MIAGTNRNWEAEGKLKYFTALFGVVLEWRFSGDLKSWRYRATIKVERRKESWNVSWCHEVVCWRSWNFNLNIFWWFRHQSSLRGRRKAEVVYSSVGSVMKWNLISRNRIQWPCQFGAQDENWMRHDCWHQLKLSCKVNLEPFQSSVLFWSWIFGEFWKVELQEENQKILKISWRCAGVERSGMLDGFQRVEKFQLKS